jgi:hypothetical protein
MKEYAVEKGKKVNLDRLKAHKIPPGEYRKVHAGTTIACHDIFIEHNGGIILGVRATEPDKRGTWPIGGRIQRGVGIEESLRRKVKEELNLEIEGLRELGTARTFLSTDPFGHGKGTDTLIIVYYGKGKGKPRLNRLNTDCIIVTPGKYTKELRAKLHPYVRDFTDLAMKRIKKR